MLLDIKRYNIDSKGLPTLDFKGEYIRYDDIEELKKDFENLLENYWYSIRTRECTLLQKEQESNEKYAKDLYEKYKIV